MMHRVAFYFQNPNHAAALLCELLPLCWGWRRYPWLGRILSLALFAALLMTQSRTGLFVVGLEAGMWLCLRENRFRIPDFKSSNLFAAGIIAVIVIACWWMWPRLALDGAILNRPKIWLSGLQLFAANPNGVGLCNSGVVASAFLLGDIPDVRTMISTHITLLAEFGWAVGWAWLVFIGLALCGLRTSPRIGIAFAGLVLSGCTSTVFDWPVLFDFAGQGGLGMTNWLLSWMMFTMFVGFGVRLIFGRLRYVWNPRPTIVVVVLTGMVVLGLRLVPAGNAPQVHDGYVSCGDAPRTLALYDEMWKLKAVARRVKGGAVLPVRGISRFPREMDLSGIDKVMLFGDCCEWKYLVKESLVECVEE